MKVIIMCGGNYKKWETPRHLTKINGETLVERTVRLLKENKVEDIFISTNNPAFDYIDVPKLKHSNDFTVDDKINGYWVDCFYPTDEPTIYLLGDVFYSEEAIKTILNTETDDIEFFASAPPFNYQYTKPWAEPFGFKVVNLKHFKEAIELTKKYRNEGKFRRHPIAWEFWQVVKGHQLNYIDYNSYTVINDYTCDVDKPADAEKIERAINGR